MEGLVLNEKTEYVTYLEPIFDAVGRDYISRLNWRITYPEVGGSATDCYSFEGNVDSWISGKELLEEIDNHPNLQWWWGLLQGFETHYSKEEIQIEEPVDIQLDITIWELPVTMRNDKAEIEIEAFDSTQTIVVVKDNAVLEKLKTAFPDYDLLSELNSKLED